MDFNFNINTQDDKWNVIQLLLFGNCFFGALLLLSSIGVSDVWGSGAFFQLFSTATINLIFSLSVLMLVRNRSVQENQANFIGSCGIFLSLNLTQSTFLWHDFGHGLRLSSIQKQCEELLSHEKFPSGGIERTCSTLSFLCSSLISILCFLSYKWKEDLFSNANFPWNRPESNNTNVQSFDQKFPQQNLQEQEDDYDNYQNKQSLF